MLFYRLWIAIKSKWYLRSARKGRRVRVHGRLHVQNAGAIEIGDETNFHKGKAWSEIFVSKDALLRIGRRCKINKGCNFFVTRAVFIGNDCKLGWNVSIMDNNFHGVPVSQRSMFPQAKPVNIKDQVWIGANCTIMPGVTIGRGAIVCAGSLVTRNVMTMTMVGGVPAKYIRDIEP